MKIRAILASDDTSTANVAVEVDDTQMTYVTGIKGFKDPGQRFPLIYIQAAMAKYMYLPVTPPVEVDTFSDIPEIMSEYERVVHKATIGPVVQIDTSIDSTQQTLNRLIKLLEPHFTKNDRARIENHKRQISV